MNEYTFSFTFLEAFQDDLVLKVEVVKIRKSAKGEQIILKLLVLASSSSHILKIQQRTKRPKLRIILPYKFSFLNSSVKF